MAGKVPHSVPGTQSSWLPATLAIIVHLALLAFFWIGISWKSDVKLAVEAEIWDMQYKDAAPLPEPVSEPEPQVQEQPQPEPPPVVAPPEPKVEPPPVENPEIALEKERKKKEEQRKEELRKEAEKQELLKKQEAEKLAQQKAEQEKKKAEEDKKKAEEQKKADELAKKQAAEDKKKAEADAKKKAAEAKASEARRQAEVQRMMSQAGGSGTAEKSQGPRGASNYASKVAVKIRSNTIFDVPANLSGNPAVEYTVDLMPDGSVRNSRRTKSSGVPGFDEAVASAIQKSQPFPPDVDGKVPGTINIIHRPKDQ